MHGLLVGFAFEVVRDQPLRQYPGPKIHLPGSVH
jgi:hypothetical protein